MVLGRHITGAHSLAVAREAEHSGALSAPDCAGLLKRANFLTIHAKNGRSTVQSKVQLRRIETTGIRLLILASSEPQGRRYGCGVAGALAGPVAQTDDCTDLGDFLCPTQPVKTAECPKSPSE
jgi:hypothetical protein